MTVVQIKEVTVNLEQKLYVIPSGGGYSCWGFQNCFDEVTQLSQMLGIGLPTEGQIGSMYLYHRHRELLNEANQKGLMNATWYNLNTPQRVKEILEAARMYADGQRLRLFYGETSELEHDIGRDWMSEHDMCGTIGRSTGMMKVPLLIANNASRGGSAILTDCIVRIIDTASKRELYRHPQYHMKHLFKRPVTDKGALAEGYTDEVTADGEVHARFKTAKKAEDWIAFMEGRRMRT